MPEKTTTIRLNDDDQAVIDALQKHTGIQSLTDLIRYTLRMAAQNAGVGGFGPAKKVGAARPRSSKR